MQDVVHAGAISGTEAAKRLRSLRDLARTDALGAFEGGLELLRTLVDAAARHELAANGDLSEDGFSKPARRILRHLARLLRHDARRREHEIDRETGWFVLFEIWLRDDAGVLDDFGGFLAVTATLESDRRQLVKLAIDELESLPIVFPPACEADVRRVVLSAARARLESVIGTLLAQDGRHAYALALAEARGGDATDPATFAMAVPGAAEPNGVYADARGRAQRLHLETAFLRTPSDEKFQAVKRAVPKDQWPGVRSRLLGHLQKHQREPTLVFKLYWNEDLLVDADGLVVTQPVDPDLLARAAMKLREHEPVVAAGWLLISASRLADSFPKSRWPDVVGHLVLVRELTARCDREGEFNRVLRTFRFRHAHSPDLLNQLSEVGL